MEQILLDEIFPFVKRYWEQYRQPVPFRAVSQKWSKRARIQSINLLNEIESDPRFIVDLSTSGAYRIGIPTLMSPVKLIMMFLNRMGGYSKLADLQAKCHGVGIAEEEFKKTMDYAKQVGIVTMTDTDVTLEIDPNAAL